MGLETEVTIQEIEAWCAEAFDLRDRIQTMERETDEWKAKLKEVQEKIHAELNLHGKDSYKSNAGTISIAKKLSVKVPNTPDEKKAFFDYLRSKGIFEDMVNIHSQRLNSYYRAEWDIAVNEGVTNFSMPGIGEPTYYEQIQMRK